MKLIENWVSKRLTCSVCGETRSVKYEAKNGEPMCNKCILLHDGDCDELSISDVIVEALKKAINVENISTYNMGGCRGIHLWDKAGKWFEIEIAEVR